MGYEKTREISVSIYGDPEDIASFFRAVNFQPGTPAGGCWEPVKIPGNRAVMEFERSRVLREGNPNIFERK